MATPQQAGDDLAYVRDVVENAGDVHIPGIYLIWAVIGSVGFALVDFAPYQWIAGYWAIMGPAGFIASWRLGAHASTGAGIVNRSYDQKWCLHWGAFGAAGLLGIALPLNGLLAWQGFGSLWVLLLALAYTLAGVHLERRMLPLGVLMGLCFLITLFVPQYGWTTAGAVAGLALSAQAFLGRRSHDRTN